jgi:hypothetical protein
MKLRTLCLSIAAFLSTMAAIPTYAAEASTAPAATPASGTHDTRKAERKKSKADMSAQNKKTPVSKSGEASPTQAATPASGTHDTRSAERKQTRAANTEANKKGQLPGTNEAGQKK